MFAHTPSPSKPWAPSTVDKIGVFSRGLPVRTPESTLDFVERNTAPFAGPAKTNQQLKLFWIGVGKVDHHRHRRTQEAF